MLIIGVGAIYAFDLVPSARTKELRDVVDELNKLTLSGAGDMRWCMAPKEGLSSERTLSYDLVYIWTNDDVRIKLELKQRRKATATIVLSLGDIPMPTWHYGLKVSQPLIKLVADLRQILGENDIRVVPESSAA